MSDKFLLVAVSGYRHFKDEAFVHAELDRLLSKRVPEIKIITGECKTGVDGFAKSWAEKNGCAYEGFEADWEKYDKAAGPIRNRQMAIMLSIARDEGDDVLCICFVHPKSSGTKGMLKEALNRDIPNEEIKIN